MNGTKYRNYSKRNSEEISPRIKGAVAIALDKYCRKIDKSVSFVTEKAIAEYLEKHKMDEYLNLPLEELARRCMEAELALNKEGTDDGIAL